MLEFPVCSRDLEWGSPSSAAQCRWLLASRWPGIKRAHRGHKGSKARRGTKATAESEGYPAPTIRMGRRAPMAKTALLVLRA